MPQNKTKPSNSAFPIGFEAAMFLDVTLEKTTQSFKKNLVVYHCGILQLGSIAILSQHCQKEKRMSSFTYHRPPWMMTLMSSVRIVYKISSCVHYSSQTHSKQGKFTEPDFLSLYLTTSYPNIKPLSWHFFDVFSRYLSLALNGEETLHFTVFMSSNQTLCSC